MATQLRQRPDCSEAEWKARQDLAACYRIFDMLGWSESIYNHITLRVPGEDDAFLINPYGLLWFEVAASNLVKIDIEGNKLDGSPYPVNKAGFTQHSCFHANLPWAHAIVHTHTTETMAVCSTQEGLTPTNFYSCFFQGMIGYHDFEGITVRADEGPRLLRSLGNGKPILMLRNHGPLIVGRSVREAFSLIYYLERACRMQVASLSQCSDADRELVFVEEAECAAMAQAFQGGESVIDREWNALVRMLQQTSPGFDS